MNLLFHHIAQRLVHYLMPLHVIFTEEARRYNRHGKMPTATLGALVPGVQVTVVAHLDGLGLKSCAQTGFDLFGARQGSTLRNGFTVTPA